MKVLEVNFRPATVSDSSTLLEWRNDPETRANSIQQGFIDPDTHRRWLNGVLTSNDNLLLMAEVEGRLVGSLRLDKLDNEWEGHAGPGRLISYVVAPEMRKRGYGRAIIQEAITSYGQSYGLLAVAKTCNSASHKIMEDCGFRIIGMTQEDTVAYFKPTTRSPDTVQ